MNTITINQIGCLLVRGISLFLAVEMFAALGFVANALMSAEADMVTKIISVFPYTAFGMISILLWIKAPWISTRMIQEETEVLVPFTFDNIQIALLVTVGFLVFLTRGLESAFLVLQHIISVLQGQDTFAIWQVTQSLLIFGMSLFLIFSPRGIVNIIRYTRVAGTKK